MKLKDIKAAPWNTRGEITPESVATLAASIKEQGLINPLTLWWDDHTAYCIAGNRRLAALVAIYGGKHEVMPQWHTAFTGSREEAKMVTVTENFQREDVGIIEEAALVGECLDAGMSAEAVSAKTGRSLAWVNRRRRLLALAPEWKDYAAKYGMDADALEKISSYESPVQKRVAKSFDYQMRNGELKSWREIAYQFEREMRNLDAAKFDTTDCVKCLKRTGVDADLFGLADGALGKCKDCKCFEKRLKAWANAKIKEAVGDAEVVTHQFAWQMPSEDESSEKRTKKHPCAHVFVRDGEVEVLWTESEAKRIAAEERKEAERKAANEARAAERKRFDDIKDRVWQYLDATDDDGNHDAEIVKLAEDFIAPNANEAQRAWLVDALVDKFCEWRNDYEMQKFVRTFDAVAFLAGVSGDDRDYFVAEKTDND